MICSSNSKLLCMKKSGNIMKRIISLLTACVMLMMTALTAFDVYAEKPDQKVVRVGWYESTYSYKDQFGRRCGMVYEYQQKIAAHTGWTYEYVEDSWPNLLQMMKDGKIDLMSDVSYTEERAKSMLYSSYKMGTESYYVYIDADNKEINAEDLTSFNGQRVGVNKGSIQAGILREWAKNNGINIRIIELEGVEIDSLAMVTNGEIDAFVTMDTLNAIERMCPVCKIGSSDYYFAVNKARPDLLNELDMAMNSIQDEDPYFNQSMMNEWIHLTKTNAFLVPSLEGWISGHGKIRIGYLDDYLPFCALDSSTGEVTGALRDFIAYASTCMKNADISFTAVPFSTTDAALQAMKNGEIDCVFPINLSSYDGEVMGIFSVAPIMQTEMSIMIHNGRNFESIRGQDLTVAVDKGNINFETFIKDNFPEWTIKYFPDDESCYKAVSEKEADAVLLCNYCANLLEPMESKYKLKTVPIGHTMRFSFAVNRDSHELYSILDKISNLTSKDNMEFVLAAYMYSPQSITIMQFLKENWIIIIAVISCVFAGFIILMITKLKAEKKVNEQQRQIEEVLRRELQQQKELQSVTRIAYTDPLTGVKNKHSYVIDEEKMNQRIKKSSVSEFAIVIFDLNYLKVINDTKGHQAGDQYIKDGCSIICNSFKHSPVYRIGGDEFVAVLEGTDFAEREELLDKFEKKMSSNSMKGAVTIAAGCAVYDPENDRNVRAVFERADQIMYDCKKNMKK